MAEEESVFRTGICLLWYKSGTKLLQCCIYRLVLKWEKNQSEENRKIVHTFLTNEIEPHLVAFVEIFWFTRTFYELGGMDTQPT